jgi:hypothetical protein
VALLPPTAVPFNNNEVPSLFKVTDEPLPEVSIFIAPIYFPYA